MRIVSVAAAAASNHLHLGDSQTLNTLFTKARRIAHSHYLAHENLTAAEQLVEQPHTLTVCWSSAVSHDVIIN